MFSFSPLFSPTKKKPDLFPFFFLPLSFFQLLFSPPQQEARQKNPLLPLLLFFLFLRLLAFRQRATKE